MTQFELTSESKVNFLGITLFRIRLTADCKWGKAGDIGGWVEKVENVSGDAWVSGNAEVFGNARVYGNAEVSGGAEVYGDAKSTKKVFVLNFKWQLTLTDNHIKYGCIQKTIQEWVDWLQSDEEFETKRSSKKFKIIEMSLNLAIEQWKQLNN